MAPKPFMSSSDPPGLWIGDELYWRWEKKKGAKDEEPKGSRERPKCSIYVTVPFDAPPTCSLLRTVVNDGSRTNTVQSKLVSNNVKKERNYNYERRPQWHYLQSQWALAKSLCHPLFCRGTGGRILVLPSFVRLLYNSHCPTLLASLHLSSTVEE